MNCPNCARSVEIPDAVNCPFCGALLNQSLTLPPQLPPSPPPVFTLPPEPPFIEEPAWERRHELGFGTAFFRTIKDVLLRPAEVFAHLDPQRGIGGSLIFGLILGTIGFLFAFNWQIILQYGFSQYLDMPSPADSGIYSMLPVASIFIAPITTAIGIFLQAAINHLMLLIVARPKSLAVTLRVVAYAQGATALLAIVPVCGALIQSVWAITVIVIGYREAHRISGSRAALAVLLPLILCCVCIATIAALFFIFTVGLFSHGQSI